MLRPLKPITNAPYTDEERNRLRAKFVLIATEYHRRKHITRWCIGAFFALVFLLQALSDSLNSSVGIVIGFGMLAILLVVLIAGLRMASLLICPGCKKNLEEIGSYCPECGSQGLEPGSWFSSPRCPTCGKKMRRNKGRHYLIRACSHCGLYLDKEGL